ncbi:hypothetical protein [uncultured Halomonas sp.]|uniref:hypothetical protein n=1 Tax=uncultured Halomonas sp. TaxID=173971 RepID=UPI00260BA3BE|nr:hypothetical protein [uncultured Halomonas sp.]
MKPFSILLIRLLGLYLFLSTLLSVLPALLGPNVDELWSAELLPVLLATVAVPLVSGALLWGFSGRLASRLHGGGDVSGGGDVDAGIRDEDLVRAGTFLIGIYLLVRHAGALVGMYATSGGVAYGELVVVLASLGMILGGRGIVGIYRRAKNLGTGR